MALENVPLIRPHQINGGKPDLPDKLAKLLQGEKIECPACYGVMDITFSAKSRGFLSARATGPSEPSAITPREPVAALRNRPRLLIRCVAIFIRYHRAIIMENLSPFLSVRGFPSESGCHP